MWSWPCWDKDLTVMASACLRKELECSICLNVYSDPVNLTCGHSYCRVCIDRVLETQEESGDFWCPQCRKRFRGRPELQRNLTLCHIVESFHSTQRDQDETRIFCTYCIHFPVAAVKSCLHCEASLCEDHLRVHSKSPEHVLSGCTIPLENRKCSVHKKILEYFCIEDAVCICVSCCIIGEHKGHQIESLDEASEKIKKKLSHAVQQLLMERGKVDKILLNLLQQRRKLEGRSAGVKGTVTALFRSIKRQLEELEKTVHYEISKRTEQLSLSVSQMIQQMEVKKEELSKKICHTEELCNMSDPLIVLQESDTSDTKENDTEDRERLDEHLHDVDHLDVTGISNMLHSGLCDLITRVNGGVHIPEPVDILLDLNTGNNQLHISHDMKAACRSHRDQNLPETPDRFQDHPQVLSSRRFFSGRHYWEVDLQESLTWRVGMCYPSIDRRGRQAVIGLSDKSWGLFKRHKRYFVIHDGKEVSLPTKATSNRIRISLDYEAGRISFYELGVPIRHIHTFTSTFTEPLHAALCVWRGSIKISGRKLEM